MDERKQGSSEQLKEGDLKHKYLQYIVSRRVFYKKSRTSDNNAHMSYMSWLQKSVKKVYFMKPWKHNEHYHWMQKMVGALSVSLSYTNEMSHHI